MAPRPDSPRPQRPRTLSRSSEHRVAGSRVTKSKSRSPRQTSKQVHSQQEQHILMPTLESCLVYNTLDALYLFEATLQGACQHISHRPVDKDRDKLIRSGSVFVYQEGSSGIKRWTDGKHWSPSRSLGNFLVYRELEGPFPSGEKKKANKEVKKQATNPKSQMVNNNIIPANELEKALSDGVELGTPAGNDILRSLIGSLVDSYNFKDGGLVKKTITINVQGTKHHMVCYYTLEDVIGNQLMRACKIPSLLHCYPRHAIVSSDTFKVAIHEELEEAITVDPSQPPLEYIIVSHQTHQQPNLLSPTPGQLVGYHTGPPHFQSFDGQYLPCISRQMIPNPGPQHYQTAVDQQPLQGVAPVDTFASNGGDAFSHLPDVTPHTDQRHQIQQYPFQPYPTPYHTGVMIAPEHHAIWPPPGLQADGLPPHYPYTPGEEAFQEVLFANFTA